jgi:CubicO group peptidase (beta-lactamase class C family)
VRVRLQPVPRLHRCVFATILVGASAFAQRQPFAKHTPAGFDLVSQSIRARIARQHLSSVSIAIARRGTIVYEESFGFADKEERIAASPHTTYTLGSLSKPITATALMIARDRGLLKLDRPVNAYLGGAKLYAHVGTAANATEYDGSW